MLIRDSLPTDSAGQQLDLAPGDPLPEGATPAARPDLYEAGRWVAGMFFRCYPDRRDRAAATRPGATEGE